MKLWRHTLITALTFFGITGLVFYTSCEKDSCEDLRCYNGGACVEGFCRCAEGWEGTECKEAVGDKFVGYFIGHNSCSGLQPLEDTVEIWMVQEPSVVKFVQHSRITDTLEVTAVGKSLSIPVREEGNSRTTVRVEKNEGRLEVFYEHIFDVNNPENRRTCKFVGDD